MDEQAGSRNKEIAKAASQERRVMLFDLKAKKSDSELRATRSLKSVATACAEVS